MNYVGREPAPSGLVLVGDTNPIGEVSWHHKVPDGSYLQLNGQAVAKATYPDLWAYAQGFLTADQVANPGLYRSIDANTFAVPKLDGLFIRAQGQYDANRVAGALGVFQGDQLQDHTHNVGVSPIAGAIYRSDVRQEGAAGNSAGVNAPARFGQETRGPNVALIPCVKALRVVLMPATAMPVPSTRLISEQIANNTSPSLNFTNLTGYWGYRFIIENLVPAADNIVLGLRVSQDNGATWYATAAYMHSYSGVNSANAANSFGSPNQVWMSLIGGISNSAGHGFSGEVLANEMNGPGGRQPHFTWQGGALLTGTVNSLHVNGWGLVGGGGMNSAPCNAVQFGNFTGGNWATGRIRCYGITA